MRSQSYKQSKFHWMALDEKGSDDGLLTKLKLGTGELVYFFVSDCVL